MNAVVQLQASEYDNLAWHQSKKELPTILFLKLMKTTVNILLCMKLSL